MTQTNCIPLFCDPKTPQGNKRTAFLVIFFFDFIQAPMSNVTKDHVKIDTFKETKNRLDPNQVH